ncbi:hypothetical protein P7K49_023145 [Saguinus oedipus]|uniref:Uncharacterized protein n=1 Tax=Saguinus oedipus TaxID=9490 RepID=A0ABQ9UKW7_SAGOE|nr:hypothetical protein P7K49_023145 [Saguinus oedipus]
MPSTARVPVPGGQARVVGVSSLPEEYHALIPSLHRPNLAWGSVVSGLRGECPRAVFLGGVKEWGRRGRARSRGAARARGTRAADPAAHSARHFPRSQITARASATVRSTRQPAQQRCRRAFRAPRSEDPEWGFGLWAQSEPGAHKSQGAPEPPGCPEPHRLGPRDAGNATACSPRSRYPRDAWAPCASRPAAPGEDSAPNVRPARPGQSHASPLGDRRATAAPPPVPLRKP